MDEDDGRDKDGPAPKSEPSGKTVMRESAIGRKGDLLAMKRVSASLDSEGVDAGGGRAGPPPRSGKPSQRSAVRSAVADQIGLRLRIVYDDILTQPVPDRFFELLRQLEGVSGARTEKDGA